MLRGLLLLSALAAQTVFAAAAPASSDLSVARHFDVLIRGGIVVDGSGATRYRADVGIIGDQIVAIGRHPDAQADRVIDANGRIVTPGFIDLHAHIAEGTFGEQGLLSPDRKRRAAQNFVAQGITTALANQDGEQPRSLREQRTRLEQLGIGLNIALLNGHSGMRHEAMKGAIGRAATVEETRLMQAQLERDLAEGESFGLSLGVEYEGARHSSTEEQLALGRVLAAYNGIFIPHLRSQGIAPMWYRPSQDKDIRPPTLDDAIDETLRVAEESGATVVFTHMKARGPGYRGQAAKIVRKIAASRARGARVYMDVYPYGSADSDNNFVAIPAWMFGSSNTPDSDFDYREAFRRKWIAADGPRRAEFTTDLHHLIAYRGGVDNIRVLDFPRTEYIGKSYGDLMQLRNLDEVQLALTLQEEGNPKWPGGVRMRSFSMDEYDVETFYRLDWCAVSTDAWIVLPEEAVGEKKYVGTHQRLFGSYPRRLAYFSQQRGVDSLEHAVHAASGLPADILNLHDRGRVAAGMKADLVVLDMAKLKDNTTYLEPSVYPSGVEYVLVNGEFALDGGQRTLALAGRVLRPAASHKRSGT